MNRMSLKTLRFVRRNAHNVAVAARKVLAAGVSVAFALTSAAVGFTGGTILTTSPLTVPLVDGDHGTASNFKLA